MADHNDEQQQPVFHPISLTDFGRDDDDDASDSDSDNDEEDDDDDDMDVAVVVGSKPRPKNKRKRKATKKAVITNNVVPLHENAIQDCFLLAVKSHYKKPGDKTPPVLWHWDTDKNQGETAMDDAENRKEIDVDPQAEEEALQNWTPRPLRLPTWAVKCSPPGES